MAQHHGVPTECMECGAAFPSLKAAARHAAAHGHYRLPLQRHSGPPLRGERARRFVQAATGATPHAAAARGLLRADFRPERPPRPRLASEAEHWIHYLLSSSRSYDDVTADAAPLDYEWDSDWRVYAVLPVPEEGQRPSVQRARPGRCPECGCHLSRYSEEPVCSACRTAAIDLAYELTLDKSGKDDFVAVLRSGRLAPGKRELALLRRAERERAETSQRLLEQRRQGAPLRQARESTAAQAQRRLLQQRESSDPRRPEPARQLRAVPTHALRELRVAEPSDQEVASMSKKVTHQVEEAVAPYGFRPVDTGGKGGAMFELPGHPEAPRVTVGVSANESIVQESVRKARSIRRSLGLPVKPAPQQPQAAATAASSPAPAQAPAVDPSAALAAFREAVRAEVETEVLEEMERLDAELTQTRMDLATAETKLSLVQRQADRAEELERECTSLRSRLDHAERQVAKAMSALGAVKVDVERAPAEEASAA